MQWIVAIVLLLTVAVGNVPNMAWAQDADWADSDQKADRQAIRELLAANEVATNERDPDGVVATFLSDAELWIAGGPRFVGLAEIRQNEQEFYRTPGLLSWTIEVESIRFVTRDVALVRSASTTKLESGVSRSRESIVIVRESGAWRIAAVHVMGGG